jgi:protein gp37
MPGEACPSGVKKQLMGIHTNIEWCDSTCNPTMGCDGCELWSFHKRTCYAGVQIERYQGASPNFPAIFTEPKLYTDRLQQLAAWKDLTGTARPNKPWLNGLPRLVFLCDMGDPFTESLPIDWLAPHLEFLGALPHIFIVLTKRPRRMFDFSQRHPFPTNFWLLASVSSAANLNRLYWLKDVGGGSVKGVSYEPALGPVEFGLHNQWLQWIIAGGESGPGAVEANPAWFQDVRDRAAKFDVPFFFKQWGGVHKKQTGRLLDGREHLAMPSLSFSHLMGSAMRDADAAAEAFLEREIASQRGGGA